MLEYQPLDDVFLRDMAYRYLLKLKAASFPIDCIKVAMQIRIPVVPHSVSIPTLQIEESDLKAFAYINRSKKRYTISYMDGLTGKELNWLVGHELSHIFLGHFKYNIGQDIIEYQEKFREMIETDAEKMTLYTISPAIILEKEGITKPEQISEFCEIPIEKAVLKSGNLFKHPPIPNTGKLLRTYQVSR